MSAKQSASTRRAAQDRREKPSVATLQKENAALQRLVLGLQAERDETNELVTFLRHRGNELNARIRLLTTRLAELETNVDPGPDLADPEA